MAPAGQASRHFPQRVQRFRSICIPSGPRFNAFSGQILRQSLAPIQRTSYHIRSGSGRSPSGLWHQGQRRGQPLKKTVVRMPGPSSVLNCWRLKIRPVDNPIFLYLWLNRLYPSNRVGLPGNDLILDFFPQADKIGIVPRYPDQQVLVFCREIFALLEGYRRPGH